MLLQATCNNIYNTYDISEIENELQLSKETPFPSGRNDRRRALARYPALSGDDYCDIIDLSATGATSATRRCNDSQAWMAWTLVAEEKSEDIQEDRRHPRSGLKIPEDRRHKGGLPLRIG